MKLPPFTKTLVLVAMMLFVGLPKRGGSWLVVLVPVLAILVIYSLVRIATRPAERRTRLIQVSAWIATVVILGVTQAYWSAAARSTADTVVTALLGYKVRTGALPASLAQVGLDENELATQWRLRYVLRDGQAELTYPTQVMPLSTHEYDFNSRTWKLNAY